MKYFYTCMAIILAVSISCSKDNEVPEPESEEVVAQRKRDEEATKSIAELQQGITVEIVKDGTNLNGNITIYEDFPDYSDVDFGELSQIVTYLNKCKPVVVKPSYKKYGFELPTGKYLVHVYVGYPQTCPEGAVCNPPTYYSIKEFEVKDGVKTTARIDFKGIDDVDDPGSSNYVPWP